MPNFILYRRPRRYEIDPEEVYLYVGREGGHIRIHKSDAEKLGDWVRIYYDDGHRLIVLTPSGPDDPYAISIRHRNRSFRIYALTLLRELGVNESRPAPARWLDDVFVISLDGRFPEKIPELRGG